MIRPRPLPRPPPPPRLPSPRCNLAQALLLGNDAVSADALITAFSLMLPLVGFSCSFVIAPVLEGHVGEHT